MSKLTPVLGAALVLVATAFGGAWAQEADSGPVCADCHDEVAASFALTPHGQHRDDVPACTTCHGDGTRHIEEGGDPSLIKIPSGAGLARMCASCHSNLHSAFESGEVHTRAGVTCESCHEVHPKGAPANHMLKADPVALCGSCHAAQARTFDRPYGHRLGRAGLDCVSCHNPHGGPGERSLKVDRAGDIACVSCHADLRGPFVYTHPGGATATCITCHEPHGSSNPHALRRARVDQLCLECHSPTTIGTLGSQPPSFHDLRSPRYRNCTVCHVAVHGSNASPTLQK